MRQRTIREIARDVRVRLCLAKLAILAVELSDALEQRVPLIG